MELEDEERALIVTALKFYEAHLRKEREQLREALHLCSLALRQDAERAFLKVEERVKNIRFKLD